MEIKYELREIRQEIEKIETINLSRNNSQCVTSYFTQLLPCRTSDDIEKLENLISSEGEYQQLMNLLSHVGGDTVQRSVYYIMKKLLDNQLAMQYSGQGKKQKLPFCNLKLYKAVTVSEERPIFCTTTRGRKCLILSNYVFYVNQVMNNRYFWMCRNYYHTKCKARCVTSVDDQLQRISKNHNHPPDCDRAQLMLMKRAAVQQE